MTAIVCSRVYRRALSMETAARFASSSAKDRSSSVNGGESSVRQKFATPSTTPRARSGTTASERMP